MRKRQTTYANWYTSEFKRTAEREARKRVHALALTFGILTGAVWSSVAAHFLFGN